MTAGNWIALGALIAIIVIPFVTAWNGDNHFAGTPTSVYGVVMLMAAIAYYILQQTIIASQGTESVLKKAVGGDWKGKASPLLYLAAIIVAPWARTVAMFIFVLVALIWLVPDTRIERILAAKDS